LVQLLIEKGAHLNAKNECGNTPLEWVWWNYKKDDVMDIVQLMVQNGADMFDIKNLDR